ncbi:DNA alkylation repair protein [Saccharicrinis fermentans]|uniref:DNA alkylation repair enzyme n=1 Tax=Saccharicrinis fermentans DSM 9555 = JCM 21142 TaxID=869213 RepID=W7YGB5_9BACT|nr:DNA alkylation repair protein [Saccharicrinis fermentans]GAF01639.1 DNA alkylation repair enzyme [Saccharicrinis fermentans DSM 9555 = JCM 21142]
MRFYMQDDTSNKVDEIIRRLKKLMDGDVSSQMKERGLDYQLNYGASILWLRKVAKEYGGDNKLADRLWSREVRETMILATMIADPLPDNKKWMEEWALLLHHGEIAEQLGSNLLWRLPDLKILAEDWLKGDHAFLMDSVWVGLAVFLQRGGGMDLMEVNKYIGLIEQRLSSSNRFTQRVQGRFLRQVCRKSALCMTRVEDFVTGLSHPVNGAWLIEDVKTEIAFVKSGGI